MEQDRFHDRAQREPDLDPPGGLGTIMRIIAAGIFLALLAYSILLYVTR